MKCSKCGEEIRNFPEHLEGLANVTCSKCTGKLPEAVDLQGIREKYLRGVKPAVTRVDEDDDARAA